MEMLISFKIGEKNTKYKTHRIVYMILHDISRITRPAAHMIIAIHSFCMLRFQVSLLSCIYRFSFPFSFRYLILDRRSDSMKAQFRFRINVLKSNTCSLCKTARQEGHEV
eukprot:437121_1